MPTTIETTVYKYDELKSEKAKERARDWFREGNMQDTMWADFVIEDAQRMAALMGIEIASHDVKLMGGGTRQDPTIYWSLGYCQSDYACFEGSISFKADAAKLVSDETGGSDGPLIAIAARLEALQSELHNCLTCRVSYHHYYGMQIEALDATTAEGAILGIDETQLRELQDIVRSFNNWIYNGLQKECDYRNTDETVAEDIRTNEYTFTADGKRFG